MAWVNKYRFRFDSVHGVEYNIYILKDGYSGDVIQRALGRAPVLKKKQNGPICGTSLELYAQCDVDGEFAELYTSDPKEYKVEVYRAGTLIWFGFVSTELYSEPSIAPPYDVQIVATDGLGELKLNNYEAQGEISLKALFMELLSYTGSNRDFYFATNIKHTGGSKDLMLSWTIDIDFLDGKSCYDVLTQLLESLHATITTYNGRWLIARETDIETLLSNAGELSVVTCSASGTVSTATLSGVRKTLGQMGVANMWPNGNLSTSIEPARNSVVVRAPWHLVEAFQGADLMKVSSCALWAHDNLEVRPSILDPWVPATHYSDYGSDQTGGYYVGDTLSGDKYGFISRSIPMGNINGMSFDVAVKVVAETINPTNIWRLLNGSLLVYLKYTDTTGDLYWTEQRGWTTQLNSEYTDLGAAASYQRHELSFSVPPCTVRTTTAGTLTFYVSGRNFRATYANIALTRPEEGYQDTIYINNGARGAADEVELIPSRALSDNIPAPTFYQGLWKYSGEILYSFADSNNSGKDFMSLQALSRAISVAMARTKTEGLVDVPSELSTIPLIVRQWQQDSWINTWDWDLRAEDVKISSISMPNASITVESEEVIPIEPGKGSYSGGGSGSGGSSGGSGSGGGATLLRMWQSLTNNGELTDYDAETKIALEHISSFLEINEYATGHYALKVKPSVTVGGNVITIDGLFADGFIAAGGVGSSSGGSGIDLDRVWQSLTNNTDKPNVKINAAHIPIATAAVIGGVKVDGTTITIDANGVISAVGGSSGSVTSVALTVPTGLSVSGSPITSSGTLAITFANGYSIPTTAKQSNWDTAYNNSHSHSNKSTLDGISDSDITNWNAAYGWGDHSGLYLPISGGTLTGDLRIKGSTNYGRKLNFGDGDYVYLYEDSDDHLKIYASKGLQITTGSSYYVQVDNEVVIGETSRQSAYKLYVNGAGYYNGALTVNSNISSTALITVGSGTSTEIARKICFGSTSYYLSLNTSNQFHFSHGVYSDSFMIAGGAASSSDRRLKSDIEDVGEDRALAVLMQLRPKEWTWNEKSACFAGMRGAGLVAQDVQEVLPFAVMDVGDYLSLNYSVLHAYEIGGLQNHEGRIAALEAENKELKKQLAAYATR